MRKFLFITIFVLILYSISVNAVPDFKFNKDSVNLSGKISDSPLPGIFTVNNDGDTALDINFTDYTLTHTDGINKLTISSLSTC